KWRRLLRRDAANDMVADQINGRCLCHSVACSKAPPARNSVASPSRRPTSCRLGGGPPLPSPPGSESVGLRLMLNGAVNDISGLGPLKASAFGGIESFGSVIATIEGHASTSI